MAHASRLGQKLLKRVKERDAVINTTDKSGQLCIRTMENYIIHGKKHIKSDREIQWSEVVPIQRRVSSHVRVLVKIFNVGEHWGEDNQKRVNGAYYTEAGVVPVLSTMVKDHKPLEEGQPKTRPVVSCSTSVNGRLSEFVSDVLVPVAIAQHSDECLSSEEMLYHVGEAAGEIREYGKNVVVSSEDVDGLFPNIEILRSAEICGEAIKETKVKYEGVDYRWAGKYIALTCTPKEIEESGLYDIVPVRKYKPGTRPGITGAEAMSRKKEGAEEENATKWSFRRILFTEKEKKMLLAKVVEIAVKTTFRNHLYQFEGKTYIQAEGGSIGLRLTGVVQT